MFLANILIRLSLFDFEFHLLQMKKTKEPSIRKIASHDDLHQNQGISINIHTPPLIKNSITFNPQDYEAIPLQNKKSSTFSKNQKICQPLQSSSSRIKLRDYLFLAQTSSTKNATQKKKTLQNLSTQPSKEANDSSLTFRPDHKETKQQNKKNKYEIDNSELLAILRKDLSSVLQESMRQIEAIASEVSNFPKNQNDPTNSQMILMFELRSMAKEKLKRTTAEMRAMVERQRSRKKTTDYDSLLEEGQFDRNLKVIKQMFSHKYLKQIQNQCTR